MLTYILRILKNINSRTLITLPDFRIEEALLVITAHCRPARTEQHAMRRLFIKAVPSAGH
jgi:hypothetical protein